MTVEDANGNPVAGWAVTLSANGSDNAFGAISGTTNASGVFTTSLASTLAQTETVTATGGGVQESTSVTFVAGPPAATKSTIVASPATVTANGTSVSTLTVTVEDANGNSVAGAAVTLSANGSDNTFGPISGTTDANGIFTTSLASTLAQTETVTATEGGVQERTSVTFVAGPPAAMTLTIVASPTTVAANGTSATTLTVTVEDANGNPVAGTAVTLSASGSDNTFGAISGTTNASGVFTTSLASTLAQTETVTVTEGGVQESTSVTFVGAQYVWAGPVAGSWDTAANWNDTTTGQNPALVPPGGNDNVTINATSAVQVISGSGNAASLTINGSTSLAGQFTTGTLTTLGNGDTLELGANASLTIGAAESTIGSGLIQLDGGTLTDAAGITLAGTSGGAAPTLSGFGTVAAPLTVIGNALVQLNGGTLTDSSGITFSQGGYLKGHGIVAAPLSADPNGGFILATNGTLELASTVNVHNLELGDNTNSSGEILKLDGASTTQAVEFNGSGQTLEIGQNGSLSIGGFNILDFNDGAYVQGLANGTIQLDGGTLTDLSGLALDGGLLTGNGTLSGAVTNSNGGTIIVTGGNMSANNGITNSAAITIASDNTLSTSGALINNTSGVITVNGALTESGNTQIINHGTISLVNGSLQDTGNGGISSTGTITNSGTSMLNVGFPNAISNSGALNVTSGTLTIIGNMDTTTSTGVISVPEGTTLNVNGLFETDSGSQLTLGGTLAVSNDYNFGTTALSGGSLSSTGGIDLTPSGSIIGTGTLNAGLNGDGLVEASGGKLAVTSEIFDSNSLQIANGGNSTLELDGSVASGTSVAFLGSGGTLELTSSAISGGELGGFAATISGLQPSSDGVPTDTNSIDLSNIAKTSITSASVSGSMLTVNTTGGIFNLRLGSAPLAGTDVLVASDGGTGSDLFLADLDANEQTALHLTVNGNSTTPIGSTGAGTVAFTIAGLDPEDTGTVTFTDASSKTVVVNINGTQTSYSANLTSLTDGTVTSSLKVATDAAGNSFTPVAGNVVTLDQVIPSGSMSIVTASPTSVTADGVTAATIAVLVEDANGNVVPGAAVTLSSTGGTADTFGSATGVTNANGIFTTTLASTAAGMDTVTATEGSAQESATVTFNPGNPSGSTLIVTASPTSVTADGVTATTVAVLVEDAYGNVVPGAAVTLSSTGAGDTFASLTGVTNGNGLFTTTLTSTTAGVDTITATEGAASEFTTVTFNPGNPSGSTSIVTASPTSVTADGVTTTTIAVLVEDAYGNVIPGAAVTLSSTGGTADTFASATGVTNANGIFTTTLTSSAAGIDTVTATEGSAQESTTVTFNPGKPSGSTSIITANPTSITAEGVTTTTIAVLVEDAYGNVVPGAAVTLSSTGGTADTFGSSTGVTNSNGIFTTTLTSTAAGINTVTATEGSAQESTTVTFNPGKPSGLTSTLTASPTSVTADGVSTTNLTVVVEDAYGNLVPGAAVSLSSTGLADVFGSTFGITNANGVFTTTLASTSAQIDTIAATEGGIQESTHVTFNPGAVSASKSSIVASPTAVLGNGSATTTLTVTLEDALGNVIPGVAVTLSASGTSNTFGAVSGTTNANGIFTTTLASTVPQIEVITATEGGAQETTPVIFSHTIVTAVAASPNAGDENTGTVITLTLTMSQKVTVTGIPVLTLNDGGTAIYSSGSGSNALIFKYTVANGQNTSALAVTGNNLNGSTINITDSAGAQVDLLGANVSFAGLKIGVTVQSVTTSPSSGDLGPGSVVIFTVTTTESVKISGGTPTLSLNDGGTATYKSGSGTNVLTFNYTVGAVGSGQNASSLAVIGFNPKGATIYDSNVAAEFRRPIGGHSVHVWPPDRHHCPDYPRCHGQSRQRGSRRWQVSYTCRRFQRECFRHGLALFDAERRRQGDLH